MENTNQFYHNMLVERFKELSTLLDNVEQCDKYERMSRMENIGKTIMGVDEYNKYIASRYGLAFRSK